MDDAAGCGAPLGRHQWWARPVAGYRYSPVVGEINYGVGALCSDGAHMKKQGWSVCNVEPWSRNLTPLSTKDVYHISKSLFPSQRYCRIFMLQSQLQHGRLIAIHKQLMTVDSTHISPKFLRALDAAQCFSFFFNFGVTLLK